MAFYLGEKTKGLLNAELLGLESHFNADLLFYFGPIYYGLDNNLKSVVEDLKKDEVQRPHLMFMLTTNGGSVETVERIVNILRHHYSKVDFIIPDQAMSAGTVLALSGDEIYMDYCSALGPIDPQVCNTNNQWVPVRGYLQKVEELIEKAKNKTLTEAEFLILKDIDLAQISSYEQACNLTVDLLKKWLVQYKFKNWKRTETNKKTVTDKMKAERAEDIAKKLGDNNIWLSHGRYINIQRLQDELNLKITDYSAEPYKEKITVYNDMMRTYIREKGLQTFIHTRTFF